MTVRHLALRWTPCVFEKTPVTYRTQAKKTAGSASMRPSPYLPRFIFDADIGPDRLSQVVSNKKVEMGEYRGMHIGLGVVVHFSYEQCDTAPYIDSIRSW